MRINWTEVEKETLNALQGMKTTAEISQETGIPVRYVRRAVNNLAKAGRIQGRVENLGRFYFTVYYYKTAV
jgi:predicted transcriptional regulator